jgi:hypothetical protein
MKQIFKLAELHGVRVMGVADTEDHAVRVIYLEVPRSYDAYGDPEFSGQLIGRQAIALGHVLVELGSAMLDKKLWHDANKVRE